MKFFVDTAEVAEIRALAELGMVDGVTTNPSLIAKSGRDMKQVSPKSAPSPLVPSAPKGPRRMPPACWPKGVFCAPSRPMSR